MHINHFSNSFIKVVTKDAVIVCDPWVGFANYGGWHSCPEYKFDDLVNAVEDATHVYISHLHNDHLDPDFLSKAKLLDKVFLINKYNNPVMRNRLSYIGVKDVIEVPSFTDFRLLGETSITIVHQMTSNSACKDDPINFDIDSSIIVRSEGVTFFNQVDNPLSMDDFKYVSNYIKKTYGQLDIACFVCGAAGEYPQCFVNINRSDEKNRIIKDSLKKLEQVLDYLFPTNFFLAGGAYFIPGKFSLLNKYIAQPTVDEVEKIVPENINFLKMIGGEKITISENETTIVSPDILPRESSLEKLISAKRNVIYPYEEISLPNEYVLEDLFKEALINYRSKLKELNVVIDRQISFFIHEKLVYSDDLDDLKVVSNEKYILKIESNNNAVPTSFLKIHIEEKVFYGCITNKLIWNIVLSGSLCAYDRVPNTFEPEVLFGLNYLTKRTV